MFEEASIPWHEARKKALRFFGDAFTSPHGPLPAKAVPLTPMAAQSDLAHDAFEELLRVVMQRSRCLNMLAVHHHSQTPSLWILGQGREKYISQVSRASFPAPPTEEPIPYTWRSLYLTPPYEYQVSSYEARWECPWRGNPVPTVEG